VTPSSLPPSWADLDQELYGSNFSQYQLKHSVTKEKSGLSQKRDQPILVVISSQNKNPLAVGSIRMREIFQFEVWNSSTFVIIFSFIEISMKKFEINTID